MPPHKFKFIIYCVELILFIKNIHFFIKNVVITIEVEDLEAFRDYGMKVKFQCKYIRKYLTMCVNTKKTKDYEAIGRK